MSVCAGRFLIRVKPYYLWKLWWAGVLRTALWHWPGSRSLGFNCLHRLAYSKLGRIHAARIPQEVKHHQALSIYSPRSSPQLEALVFYTPLEGREGREKTEAPVAVPCGWTLLSCLRQFFPLSSVIAGSRLHGITTHTKHFHILSRFCNRFNPTPRVQAGWLFLWIGSPANCTPYSFIVNDCVK